MTGSRRQAREAALSVLYCAEVGQMPAEAALEGYFALHAPDAADSVKAFTSQLVEGTTLELAALDALIGQHAEHWRVDRLAVIDRIILRLAAWELQHAADTPPAVVLNEAIELARTFGTDKSPRFVNGVLDSIRLALDPRP